MIFYISCLQILTTYVFLGNAQNVSYHISGYSGKISPKIVGGQYVANREDFPYVVSVRYEGAHFCGGSIVDRNHVITAAHCCFDSKGTPLSKSKLTVVAGDLNLYSKSKSTVIRKVRKIWIEPSYEPQGVAYDIAIFTIQGRFSWNKDVQPVRLPTRSLPSGITCNVSGWGVTKYESEEVNPRLQYAPIPLVDYARCKRAYKELLVANVVCAGSVGKDSCQGDSGGPLVCNNTLAGIVSYGKGCGTYPGVYTDVAEYLTWIVTTARKSSSSSVPNILPIMFIIPLFSVILS